jgi:SRSO17 transposase
MSLLDSPVAKALLADAIVKPDSLRSCRRQMTLFMQRYVPLFYRKEQAVNAAIVVEGLLSDLERKTCEPIARRKEQQRKPIQFFVGAGKWDDQAVMAELRRHIVQEFADPHGVLIFDGSAFPKKGTESCGVKRQWCGRLGKVDNCQVGVFMSYATAQGCAPVERRLFLPEDWAHDPIRRKKAHVPAEVTFRNKWQIATDMLAAHSRDIPHGWVTADDEFGRAAEFRAQLRAQGERYVLDVPADTHIRDLEMRRPPRRQTNGGRLRERPFCRADEWVKHQPATRWTRLRVSAGEKGPIEVLAMAVRVRAKHDQRIGDAELLLVVRTVEENPCTSYMLCNTSRNITLEELVRVKSQRHRIEELFQAAKGEAGLAHYEVRSWTGWHHHITLSLLALWFAMLESKRLGKKNPSHYRPTNTAAILSIDP